MKTTYFIAVIFCIATLTGGCKKHKPDFSGTTTSTHLVLISPTIKIHQNKGYNGSALVYNPDQKLYYAFFAGNKDFPLEVYNQFFEYVGGYTIGFDIRGAWYNPATKNIEGNAYNGDGIYSIKLVDGLPVNYVAKVFDSTKMHMPNTCAAYDPTSQEVLMLTPTDTLVHRYARSSNTETGTTRLSKTPAKAELNLTSVVYTALPGQEYGLLDYTNRYVYLYNKTTGAFAGKIELPYDAPTYNKMRFSYANNYAWLYDAKARRWRGYTTKYAAE